MATTVGAAAQASAPAPQRDDVGPPPCADRVLVVVDGAERDWMCPDAARQRGLTVVELGASWTPRLFAPGADGQAPAYRAAYLAIADGRARDGDPLTGADALVELYGVVPSLPTVQRRLADEARHACHAAIDTSPLAAVRTAWSQDHGPALRAAAARQRGLARALAAGVRRPGLGDVAALAAAAPAELATLPPATRARLTRWQALAAQDAALRAAQARLACEGYYGARPERGAFSWRTGDALELFQRRNFLMPTERLDADTRAALQLDSRELDLRLALRVLRERVVDATGLVEDGTAGAGPVPVLGRTLDPAPMWNARGHAPLPDAAPDLVGAATDAAARALGWTEPERVRAFLDRHPGGVRVALPLPPAPAYHGRHMALSVELDRGDVWYDTTPIPRRASRRPALILYVDDGGRRRPLVRWPSTIGGWADQRTAAGGVVRRWKESDVGARVWRDLYAGPTWNPPPTTPDRDLVVNTYNGYWRLKSEIFGPGPRSAYGMTMLVHHLVRTSRGKTYFDDNGIRTHGSASVTSIAGGTSHGCHRLFNHLAVRLSGFLLAHRDHAARGEQAVAYRRTVRSHGRFAARVDTRGFLYELTPPVPVEVTRGRIRSARKVPPKNSAPASE